MIKNYSTRRPQSFIYQNKEVVEDTLTENKNAFLFGPCIYDASKDADESNVNIFDPTVFGDKDTVKILWAGTPEGGELIKRGNHALYFKVKNPAEAVEPTEVAEGESSESTEGESSESTEVKPTYIYYIIPNSNAWELFSTFETDKSNKLIIPWTVSDAKIADKLLTKQPNLTTIPDNLVVSTDLSIIPEANFSIEFTATRNFNAASDLIQISTPSDITAKLGPITESNPLAFAASLTLAEAGKPIFVDCVNNGNSASADDYQDVLNKIENLDIVQFLCPIFGEKLMYATDKTVNGLVSEVRKAVLAHVEAMSTESVQKWRRAYFGSPYISGVKVKELDSENSVELQAVQLPDYITAEAIASDSDRFIIVWTDNAKYLTENGLKVLNNDYVAAIIAGLRSSKLPQQGLSRQSISGISAIPNMYTIWNNQALDNIAATGVFIITQDYKNSSVYVRHQLTTDTNEGLMYWEDSVGVNVDEISYMARDLVEPYIGKRNATPQTLTEINNKWYAALLERTNVNEENPQIGPQIVQIVDGSVKTYVHKTLKDRIVLTATLVLPLPINTIVVYINAVASF